MKKTLHRATPVINDGQSTRWLLQETFPKNFKATRWGVVWGNNPVVGVFTDDKSEADQIAKALNSAFDLGVRYQQNRTRKVLGL